MKIGVRVTAGLMVTGAVAANVAFIGLGSVFDYPDVLEAPPGEVLARFRDREAAVAGLFTLLAVGAALLAPIAVGLSRLVAEARRRRAVLMVGVAAATAQVAGLLRWPVIVPVLARRGADPDQARSAADTFDTLSTVLGTAIGETAGYLLTAAWTLLVVRALAGTRLGRVLAAWGALSATLILAGTGVPLGIPGTDAANFAGYVLWSLWLVAVAVSLVRSTRQEPVGSPMAMTMASHSTVRAVDTRRARPTAVG